MQAGKPIASRTIVESPKEVEERERNNLGGVRVLRLLGSTFFGCFGRRAMNGTLNRMQITVILSPSALVSKQPKIVVPKSRSTLKSDWKQLIGIE